MGELIVFAVTGLASGALIAGLALGVVLNYRGCGVTNLGLGAIATLGAYTFHGLRAEGVIYLPPVGGVDSIPLGGPWPLLPAILGTLVLCGAGGAAFDVLVLRKLRSAPAMSKLVATVGLLLFAQAIVVLRFGATAQAAPAILPAGPEDTIMIADLPVPTNRFMLLAIVVLVTLPLVAVYRYTRFGLATRAAAENEQAAVLQGHSPNLLSLANTTAAFVLAGGFGILVAPLTQLNSTTLTLAIVPALAAALLAGFTSFTVAAAAGLAMGVLQAVVTYSQTFSWYPTSVGVPVTGISDLIFLLVIIVALIWRGNALPERGAAVAERMPRAPSPVRPGRYAVIIVLVAVGLLTFVVGSRQAVITSIIALVACLPFVALVGYIGQLSVAQLAFGGVAGLLTSRLGVEWGLGFPLAPLLAIAVATVFGTLLAIPALRVRGVNLAILTMAAAVAIGNFGFGNAQWGARVSGDPVEQPSLFGFDLGTQASFPIGDGILPSPVFGYLCLAVALALGMLVVNLRRSHLGHWMLAVRGNERAAAAAGLDVRSVKLSAFAFSAMLAGFAGVLYAYNFGSFSETRFELVGGLTFLAFVYITGVGSVAGAVMAAVMAVGGVGFAILEPILGLSDQWQAALGGLALIFMVASHPDGIVNSPGAKALPPPFNWIYFGLRAVSRKLRSTPDLPREEPSVA